MEDRGIGALDDLSLSEQTFPSQDGAGLRYSTLISGEINRDGKKLECKHRFKKVQPLLFLPAEAAPSVLTSAFLKLTVLMHA